MKLPHRIVVLASRETMFSEAGSVATAVGIINAISLAKMPIEVLALNRRMFWGLGISNRYVKWDSALIPLRKVLGTILS